MNGLTAKKLRRYALKLVHLEGVSGGEGKHEYQQALNCKAVEPAYTDGHRHDYDDDDNNIGHERMTDPDGNDLIGFYNNPGSLVTKWKWKIVYRNLKKLWKQTHGRHEIFSPQFMRRVLEDEKQSPSE
ncbi:MAG: hypothetical protein ACYS32_00540 [Planctomycetota bacterium]|jgi:hypothetical protein